jgi:hypothetical protein
MQELHPFQRSVSVVDESRYETISAPMLVSGAGHDAMAMSHLTQVRYFHQNHSIVSWYDTQIVEIMKQLHQIT